MTGCRRRRPHRSPDASSWRGPVPPYTSGMTSFLRLSLALLFTLSTVALLPAPAAACPGCRDALAGGEGGDGTPEEGFDRAAEVFSLCVLFMLGMMSLVLGGSGLAFYVMCRRAP